MICDDALNDPERRMATAYCGQCRVFFYVECPVCAHHAAGPPPKMDERADDLPLLNWINQNP